jgi:hypothetical protein
LFFILFIHIFLQATCTNNFIVQNNSRNEFLDDHDHPNNNVFKMLTNKSFCQMYSKKCIIKLIISNSKLVDNLKVTSTTKKILSVKSIEWCGSKNLSTKIKKYCTLDDVNDEQKLQNNASSKLDENINSYNSSINSLYLVYVKCRLVGIKNLEFSFDFSNTNSTMQPAMAHLDGQKFVHTSE